MRLVQTLRTISGAEISTSLTAAESDRLQELAKGRAVLEVGSSYGYSTVAMASAARHVVTIDPFDYEVGTGGATENWRAVYGSGLQDRITLIVGRSQDIMPRLRYEFGLIFIDGDHRLDAVTSDLFHARQLLADNGHLAVHDYGEDTCPDVATAIRASFGDQGRLTDTLWEWPA